MKRQFFFSIVALSTLLSLASCKKDNDKDADKGNGNGNGSGEITTTQFTVKVDNSTYTGYSDVIIASYGSRVLNITAGDLANVYCRLKITPYISPGTFTFDGAVESFDYHNPTIDLKGQSGNIVITKDWQDTAAGKRYVNGTFDINAQTQGVNPVSKQITGSFYNIPLN